MSKRAACRCPPSGNGKLRSILTACADGVTRLFDAISGECIRDFRRKDTQSADMWCLYHFNFKGGRARFGLMCFGGDELMKCCIFCRRHGGCVRSSSFSPDGDKIVAAVDDCTAKLFDLKSGRCERTESHSGSKLGDERNAPLLVSVL